MKQFCLAFLILKFVVFLWPQPGYIHPDEFFQSIEVAANAVLENINVKLPWEFNRTLERPIRASIWPSGFAAPGLLLMKWMQFPRSPSMLLRFSRIIMLTYSILCDFFLWNLAHSVFNNKRTAWQAVFFWLSSYTSWALMPRTLNNSAETFCVVLLITLVFGNFNKKSTSLVMKSGFLGFIVAIGVFLRPTFPIFACVPILVWFYKLMIFHHLKTSFKYLSTFIFCAFATSCLLVVVDSLYYRFELVTALFADAFSGKLSLTRLKDAIVLTPFNFILYQMDQSNLALHGLHPRYLHAGINMPILLGPMYLFLVLRLISSMFTRSRPETLDQQHLIALIATLIISLCGISTAPHQEFRFLMPLVPVSCLISAHYFQHLKPKGRFILIFLHLIFHLSVGFFYGFLHQSTAVRLAENVLQFERGDGQSRVLLTCSYTFPNFLLGNNRNVLVEDVGTVTKAEALSLLQNNTMLTTTLAVLPSYYLLEQKLIQPIATIFPVFSGECLSDISSANNLIDIFTFSVVRLPKNHY